MMNPTRCQHGYDPAVCTQCKLASVIAERDSALLKLSTCTKALEKIVDRGPDPAYANWETAAEAVRDLGKMK